MQSEIKRFSSRTEAHQDTENDLNPDALCLDSAAEHHKAQSVAAYVNVVQVSNVPSQAIEDESMRFQEYTHKWLGHANPGPAVLSNEVQETSSGLVFEKSQESAPNALAQV